MPARLRRCRLPDGQHVYCLSSQDTNLVYEEIFVEQVYLKHGMTFRPGDCVVDIGANTGLFEVFLNEHCPTARVIACEPIPAIYEVLSANVRGLNAIDATAVNCGIGSESAIRSFAYYPRLSCASTMYPDLSADEADRGREYVLQQFAEHPNAAVRGVLASLPRFAKRRLAEAVRRHYTHSALVECPLQTLGELIDAHHIERIDFLKIDAERSELAILHAIREADWPKIQQTVIEVHEGEAARADVEALLARHGFQVACDANPHFPNIFMVYGSKRGMV